MASSSSESKRSGVLYYITSPDNSLLSPPLPLSHLYHATATRYLSTSLPLKEVTTAVTDIDSAFCPQCLTSWDASTAFTTAQGICHKRCNESSRELIMGCVSCPCCESRLSNSVMNAKWTLQKEGEILVYNCSYCQWNSSESNLYIQVDGQNVDAVKEAMQQLALQLTERLELSNGQQEFDSKVNLWKEKFNQVDVQRKRAELLKGSTLQNFTLGNVSTLSALDQVEEKKVATEDWNVQRLEDALKERKETMALNVVKDEPSISIHDTIEIDSKEPIFKKYSMEQHLRQELVSPNISTELLPTPVNLQVRAVRRCLREIEAGRPGIVVKRKVNPLEGDSSLRYGQGQWFKKDSSAIHNVPRVTVEEYVHDLETKQFAILLRVKNPTLGPVRFTLGCVDSTTEIPDTKNIMLDSVTLEKVSVKIHAPTQKEANTMDVVTLDAVDDAFLDGGQNQGVNCNHWLEGKNDFDWSSQNSFQTLSVSNDVAYIQYLSNTIEESNDLLIGIPLSLKIELGDSSWESALIEAKGENDALELPFVAVVSR
ncbi:hypothetical protein CTEN210_01113 [Chaetoceros tenuissimus]|uniref:Dynactin subunit 4 n=1 Tax=Chaetoceros tenuissimus TaxID=426638 RepID=A0AAD3CGT7_9STRA|nr:hypothetical protein CTEN210_01113 [Chaetoceros tenuissimus]